MSLTLLSASLIASSMNFPAAAFTAIGLPVRAGQGGGSLIPDSECTSLQ